MPKPRILTARRPPCPKGHQGDVWLDGFYGRDGHHERPRFRCVPRVDPGTGKRPPLHVDGTKPHPFIEPLARRHPTSGAAAHFCEECEHLLDRHEGPQTTRGQAFTIREAVGALVQVAQGTSMRRASRDAREAADRLTTSLWGMLRPSGHGQLASDQLAMFGTMVRDALIPTPWPDAVALDETSFDVVITDVSPSGSKTSFPGTVSVLGVYGYPHGRGSGRAVALAPRGGGDAVEWLAVLRSRPNEPTWVVCDQGKAVMAAIKAAWPDATIYVCEAHLRMLAEKRLAADGFDRTSVLWKAMAGAIGDRARWERLEADAHAAGAMRTLAWMGTNRRLMERQWAVRDPNRPLSIGGLETVLREVVHRLGDRRLVFRNQSRLELVFDLMGLEMAGLATERRLREIIRKDLLRNGGRPRCERRSLDDHGSSSLYDAIRRVNARLAPKRAQNVKSQAAHQARLKAAGQSRLRKPAKLVTKRGRRTPP
jgi:hypothetical protein